MRRKYYKWTGAFVSLTMLASLAGCQSQAQAQTEEIAQTPETMEAKTASAEKTAAAGSLEEAEDSVLITLNNETAAASSSDVIVENSTVTITKAGTYTVTGTLTDGMLIVDTEDTENVEIILNGAGITSKTSAALYVRKAEKVKVILADGSENYLENGGSFEAIDDNNIDGAVFSKEDLTMEGDGSLTVISPAGHGIVCKDTLKVKSGTYEIHAEGHGLSAKDNLQIKDGDLTITCEKDGLHANQNVTIKGGSLTIASGDDGIHADEITTIEDGVILITESYEGIEGCMVEISGGDITLTASDDGINASGGFGGGFGGGFDRDIMTKPDGTGTDFVKPEKNFTQPGMKQNMPEGSEQPSAPAMTEGSEQPSAPTMPEGSEQPSDSDASQDTENSTEVSLIISGGVVRVNAGGDGLDSNGTLLVSGGEVYISGPESNMDGALDYDASGSVEGGIVIAAGSAGMAQNFDSSSTQCAVLVNVGAKQAGTTITVTDEDGKELASYTPEKGYETVVISCPEMEVGKTITITAGDYQAETEITQTITGNGGMGMGGHGRK